MAIAQRVTELESALGKRPQYELLNVKQELFCQFYAVNEETFGNATLSYALAYDIITTFEGVLENRERYPTVMAAGPFNLEIIARRQAKANYQNAAASAHRLLNNAKITRRMNFLMDKFFTDEVLDRELSYVVRQRRDLGSKTRAISEANKLKQRIEEKSRVVHEFDLGDVIDQMNENFNADGSPKIPSPVGTPTGASTEAAQGEQPVQDQGQK